MSIVLEPEIWTADVVYAGLGTPMDRGGIVVMGQYVSATGSLSDLEQSFPSAKVVRKGRALSPRVVNAHTHLDLSGTPYFRGEFTDFIRHVAANRESRGLESAKQGLRTVGNHIALIGDIVSSQDAMNYYLEHHPFEGTAFWEVLSASPGNEERVFEETKKLLLEWKSREGSVKVGLSPHATYSVTPKLMKMLCDFAALEGIPVQIHCAESPSEVEYLKSGTGTFSAFLQGLGLTPWEPIGKSPIQHLSDTGVLSKNVSLIHCAEASEIDVELVSSAGASVVFCPRSNEALECKTAPWESFLSKGVEFAFGTDSLASSPDLDVLNEVAKAWGTIDPKYLVKAASRSGHKILGRTVPKIVRGVGIEEISIWPDPPSS